MGDTRPDLDQAEERLPWLHAPRRPATPRPKAKPRRGSEAPIFVLLSLFLLAGIGVIAFLVGRGSVSLAPVETGPPPPPPRATLALPPAIAPPVVPTPAPPIAQPTAPAAETAAAPARVKAAPGSRSAKARSAPPAKKVTRITPRAKKAAAKIAGDSRRRAARRARAEQARRYAYVGQPSPAKPGRVIQLGVYYDPRHADAAWRRVVQVYPYLGKLPKAVVPARGLSNQPVYYRLQLGTRSRRDARILCRHLLSIGRGCRVV